MTVAIHTQNTFELLHRFRRRPVENCLDSFWIDGGAFSRNDMPKIGDFRKPELAFGELSIEAVFAKLHPGLSLPGGSPTMRRIRRVEET